MIGTTASVRRLGASPFVELDDGLQTCVKLTPGALGDAAPICKKLPGPIVIRRGKRFDRGDCVRPAKQGLFLDR